MADATTAASPLRRRMIKDITAQLVAGHLAFPLSRRHEVQSPFRTHTGPAWARGCPVNLGLSVSQEISSPSLNKTVCALCLVYGLMFNRGGIPKRIAYARIFRKPPTILSPTRWYVFLRRCRP